MPSLAEIPTQHYGTKNGRSPSAGKITVGVVAVDCCDRNMEWMEKPAVTACNSRT